MKVLNLLIALLALCSHSLLADDKLDKFISDNKKEQFNYDYQKNEAVSSKLRDSWIAPVKLNYSYSKSNPYNNKQTQEKTGISIDQPIFQSGGIYYGIKFAEASRIYSNYSIDAAKRKLVKDAVSLLMQIKQIDFRINKQELLIKNSEINLAQKKEQYLNGQLDSGFLNSAIVERNVIIQALYDIQTNKERLISKFQTISDTDYKSVSVPHLEVLNEEQFLKYNIILNMSDSEVEKNRYSKDVTVAKYLPRINVTAGYTWQESSVFGVSITTPATDYYNYGLKADIPLDINTFKDIEAAKVDYMKSKITLEDTKREVKSIFEQVMLNISNLQKKKDLSVENKDIYNQLLAETNELFNAGYKTKYDVELLQNSVNIQDIDVSIYDLDKQLELLTLYEMYKND